MNAQLIAGSFAYSQRIAKPCVLTIGNFDGVHIGHQQLLSRTIESAKEQGILSCVFTFEPPPRTLLAPQLKTPRIMSWQEKVEKLLDFGVDCVIIEEFSVAFAGHPPRWFATEIIERRLQARTVVVGHDFRYGKARGGTVETLRETLPDVMVEQISAYKYNSEISSSSRIRKLLADGEVEEAKNLLGQGYRIKGTIVSGEQKGREIGFPTANIQSSAELIPRPGVYAVRVQINRGRWLDGMLNIGMRPTFGGRKQQIETHIFDFATDIYGEELLISFEKRIRSEKRFSSMLELKEQLSKDKEIVRKYLE